ncbi:hypothetical protein K501DRAFT_277315 [Backusella circina FSU 941]|nr:hypothetical protein K501DRAFT_277315 [Backusella circina FSU 941]
MNYIVNKDHFFSVDLKSFSPMNQEANLSITECYITIPDLVAYVFNRPIVVVLHGQYNNTLYFTTISVIVKYKRTYICPQNMVFSFTKLGFYAFFFIYLIQISTVYAIPLSRKSSQESTVSTDPGLDQEPLAEDEGQHNNGLIPGTALLVGGALGNGNGFSSEVGKAITESMQVSASGDGGGAASTIVNLPNTGYTILRAADNDPGFIGSTTHVLFGGRANSGERAA